MSLLRGIGACALAPVLLMLSGCSSPAPDTKDPNELPEACKAIPVDRFKELIFVDDAIASDPRARNDANGSWSFRRRLEEFTHGTEEASQLAVSWLTSWKTAAKINLFDVSPRMDVEQKALCNWLRATASNECDATCGSCVEQKFDLANAPFRLMAISNRADLLTLIDDPSAMGEARFVYSLTDGPGDAEGSTPMFMSVIFEYRQPLRGRTRSELAATWHALSQHADYDETFKTELETLMQTFTEPGAEPERPRGSAINQIRTNEREFDWTWDLREYLLQDEGIVLTNLHNTPDRTLNGSPQLVQFLKGNRDALLAKEHILPDRMSGGEVSINPWTAQGVGSDVLNAFSAETCNGCHQTKNLNFNFHVSPFASGRARLSTFMNDPSDPANDDLGRREMVMRKLLCTE